MRPREIGDRADVLILDAQPDELKLLHELLAPHYEVHPFSSARALLGHVRDGLPVDLVMLDVLRPPPDGYQLCRQLRRMPQMEEVPVILLSSRHAPEDEARGLALGAVDYIAKPFSTPILLSRAGHHVRRGRAMRRLLAQNELLDQRVAARTAELARRDEALRQAMDEVSRTQDAAILALSSLAETRDHQTGRHNLRTQRYVRDLARALHEGGRHAQDIDADDVEMLGKSAALHDIGKVAIPDHILLKPGRLDAEEFEIMKSHADHGRKAIEQAESRLGSGSSFLRHAREIAYGHHERWDGRGYPQGLAGEAIPLSARLMAVADVYDALTSPRAYKPALPHAQAVQTILHERGKQFDPDLVDAFAGISSSFAGIARDFADP